MTSFPILFGIVLIAGGSLAGYWLYGRPYLEDKQKAENPVPRQKEPVKEISIDEAPNRLQYQIEKPTGGLSLIVKKGSFSKKKQFQDWKADKRRFIPNHILREDIGDNKPKYRYFVRWNLYWGEALENMTEIVPKFSAEVENIDMDNYVLDMKRAIGAIASFVLDKNTLILMAIAFFVSGPIGLPIIENLHLYPPTIVHWVNRR